ncbi:MAG: SpoIIE family protein phosphatase [bacterium]|nr:SpoIIE family protein phosphatase [bacterium]
MVLYTDGIVEAENPQGQQYSLNRLVDFIKKHRRHAADGIKEKVIAELKTFAGNSHFEDDVTFILVKIEE